MKKAIILISLFALGFMVVSCGKVKTIEDFEDTTAYVQYVTETTWEQAEDIVALLEESGIVCKKIEWSETNGILENRKIFEYYNIFNDNGTKYLLTLAIHNEKVYKQVYTISDGNDVLYKNEDVYPKLDNGSWIYELKYGYYIHHDAFGEGYTSLRKQDGVVKTIIDAEIMEFCHNDRFVGVKRFILDNSNEEWYIVNCELDMMYGPYHSEEEYINCLEEFDVSDLGNWISTTTKPDAAKYY